MDAKSINILCWDDKSNFDLERTQTDLGIFDGKSGVYKSVIRFFEVSEIDSVLKDIEDNEFVFILCHIHVNGLQGYKKFQTLLKKYPNFKIASLYVSGNREAHKQFFEDTGNNERIFTYSAATKEIESLSNIPTKHYLLQLKSIDVQSESKTSLQKDDHFDYAIFTAMYKDEFQEVEKIFENKPLQKIRTGTQIYKYGTIAGKRVVATYASKTGMVQAAAIVSDMIHRFTPQYVLMPGVCGGSSETDYCNIIVANKVFPLQNGKISDLKEKIGNDYQKVKLKYDNIDFDVTKLTDSNGHQIKIIIEKNERESEGIDIDIELNQTIDSEIENIENKIKSDPFKCNVKVSFEPMACSMMVINKDGYFEEVIKSIDRKTKAVEMESYGVASACSIVNGGTTKWLIFKSVMDKAKNKNDDYKKKAAHTSALFLKYLLELGII